MIGMTAETCTAAEGKHPVYQNVYSNSACHSRLMYGHEFVFKKLHGFTLQTSSFL